MPVSFGRNPIHHFSKITQCAEKGKRLKKQALGEKERKKIRIKSMATKIVISMVIIGQRCNQSFLLLKKKKKNN